MSANTPLPSDTSSDAVFRINLSATTDDPNLFYTSKGQYPAAAWRVTDQDPATPVTLDGLPLSMQTSNYWIISCGKELIRDHNDIWSQTVMELYAALYRAVQCRHGNKLIGGSSDAAAGQPVALGTDFGAS